MLNFFKRKRKEKKPRKKRGFFRELINDILFALVAVTIIRGLFIEAYAIPTGSMENSMLIGDHLFVSKLHYGARTPKTPIKFPLIHQYFKLFGDSVYTYSDLIELPIYRLPGFRKVRRGEPVVFNYPPDLRFPTDIKTFYVKRCVAIPGDTFEVRNKQFYTNGVPQENPPDMQTSYFAKAGRDVHPRYMKEAGITDYSPVDERTRVALSFNSSYGKGFYINADAERAAKLESYNFIDGVTEIVYDSASGRQSFPENYEFSHYDPVTGFNWSADFFGPLVIPQKGMTIPLTQRNIDLYRQIIERYDGNDRVEINGTVVTIEGQTVTDYTFQQDYYFMCGDNRHNSLDSRDWGFVPADHIVGKPLFIFWSVDRTDPNAGFFSRIRWNRMFKLIK